MNASLFRDRMRVWYWLGFGGAVGAAALMSVMAYAGRLPQHLSEHETDKVLHFTMSGVLAFFLDGALRARPLARRVAVPLSSVLILAPVGLEEVLQRFSPVRTSSIWDFAADTAGVATMTWLSRWALTAERAGSAVPLFAAGASTLAMLLVCASPHLPDRFGWDSRVTFLVPLLAASVLTLAVATTRAVGERGRGTALATVSLGLVGWITLFGAWASRHWG